MLTIPSVSTRAVCVPVKNTVGGVTIDVTSDPVYMAFLSSASAQPDVGDWYPATWDTTPGITGYDAQCVVGPLGTAVLAEGTWNVWVRIITDAEDVQEPAGQLRIT